MCFDKIRANWLPEPLIFHFISNKDSQGHSLLNGDRDLVKDQFSVLGYEDSDRMTKLG